MEDKSYMSIIYLKSFVEYRDSLFDGQINDNFQRQRLERSLALCAEFDDKCISGYAMLIFFLNLDVLPVYLNLLFVRYQ